VLLDEDKASLVLILTVLALWKPQFVIALEAIKLEKIDILSAKFRDAEDRIEFLQNQFDIQTKQLNDLMAAQSKLSSTPVYLCLSSKVACETSQLVTWQCHGSCLIPTDYFAISPDMTKVVFNKTGVYQVQVRLSGRNNTNGGCFNLQVNGVNVGGCYQSDSDSNYNTAQISEILFLSADDALQVQSHFNSNSVADENTNRLAILYLGV
jgi:hypothetical protein